MIRDPDTLKILLDSLQQFVNEALISRENEIAALSVGADRMLADPLQYAIERKQFGKPIAKLQLTQAMLADSNAQIYAARCMVLDAARARGQGLNVATEASYSKLFAIELCGRVADRGVHIHDWAGYVREYSTERFYRDVTCSASTRAPPSSSS